MNEALTVIANRYSCRKYTTQKPSREALEAIARAAVQSPSGMNRQPWTIHVVTNERLLADMEETAMNAVKAMEDQSVYQRFMERGGTIFYQAPCMFVVAAPKGVQGREMDCGIVSENIALAASSLGLGNVICGMAGLCFAGEKGREFAERIGFDEGYEFCISVLVGCADSSAKPHEPDLSKIRYVD